MSRKTITVITLAAFVLTSTSCTMWRTKNINGISDVPSKSAKIMSVVKASGERIDFSNSDPGRIRGGSITGTAVAGLSVPIDIQRPFSSIKKRADGTVYEITDGSGRVYGVQSVLKEGEAQWSVLINDRTVQRVSIPLSDVRQIRFKKTNTIMSAIAIVVPLSLGLFYLAATAAFRE
jgi:hypothetical protein